MTGRRLMGSLFLAACACVTPATGASDELLVFGAISLADALRAGGAAWSAETQHTVRFNFAASSVLALQIEAGAPADVFLSADEAKMDSLEAKQLLAPGTRRALWSNTLVLVVPTTARERPVGPGDLLHDGVRRIAIGEPRTVPAGIYAKTYLESAGLWTRLRDKLVPVENVRAALAAVESGNVDAGFVYRTDVRPGSRVAIAYEVPAAAGPRIRYPGAVLATSQHAAAARAFLAFLQSDAGRGLFQQYGFGIVTPTAAPSASGPRR